MADKINFAKITISTNGKPDITEQLQIINSQLTISDALVSPLLKKAKFNNIATCTITLGANNIAINIVNYTFSDTIYIDNFYNMPSNISILQTKGVNVHIVKQRIDLLQADCQSILLADCQINQLDIGLAEHSDALRKASEAKDNTLPTAYKMKSVDLRNCSITTAKAYVECDSINIQGSTIDIFNLHGGFGSKVVAEIKRLNIWQYSTIRTSECYCKISDFNIQESSISNLVAKSYCLFDTICIDDSSIQNAHNFEKKRFKKLDINAWMLIGKSAENDKNLSLKSEAYYQIAKENHKTEKGINRLGGKVFDFCTGYGYKPMRSLLTGFVMIILSFLVITVKDLFCHGRDAFSNIVNNLIISITAIAGQSGLQKNDGFEFWIADIEYVGAIILFAMFVNALYVRYKD